MRLEYKLDPNNVAILKTPEEFYGTLCGLYRNAKYRIVASCLYFGVDELASKLVKSICSACYARPELSVDILVDFNRSQRKVKTKNGIKTTLTMLNPIAQASHRSRISLFYNPLLNNILYHIFKSPNNEAFGVMHLKTYIADEFVIISGANLSDDYFSSKQDRYYLIQDESLSDAFHTLIGSLQNISFTYVNGSIQWDSDLSHPRHNALIYRRQIGYYLRQSLVACQEILNEGLSKRKGDRIIVKGSGIAKKTCISLVSPHLLPKDTIFCTILLNLQCPFADPPITEDSDIVCELIQEALHTNHSLLISSPYLNFTNEYIELFSQFLNNESDAKLRFINASQSTNSFSKGSGSSSLIPQLYNVSSASCLNKMYSIFKKMRVDNEEDEMPDAEEFFEHLHPGFYREYHRDNWLYHIKGLWLYKCPNNESNMYTPCATVIGSSNFGMRSRYLDLELSVCIQTNDPKLRASMHEEIKTALEFTEPVSLTDLSSRCSFPFRILYDYMGFRHLL